MVAERNATRARDEYVVLLHGMGRTSLSMSRLEKYLSRHGYKTVNDTYPSIREPIERIAEIHLPRAMAKCRGNPTPKIHFVTHSLGGIIVRQYLQANSLPDGSRLVMLAPPNQGSEVIDHLMRFVLLRWFTNPAARQLGTTPGGITRRLKPIDIEVGIIAGSKSFNPFFSALLPGIDDGRVSVERTKLEEMADFLMISSSHTFIVRRPAVFRQVAHFLEHGKFDHSSANEDC
jgi:hypothetical protein